jgi:CobQ-like glutamine amidotransferase family enzyme
MHRANEVRPVLDQLIEIGAETGCAIVLVSHLNKDSNMAAIDRILGSSDIRNAARSIVFIGGNPENTEQRVLAHAKNSLGRPGRSIAYHIDDKAHGVVIDGFTDFDEDDITKARPKGARDKPARALEEAKELLLGLLNKSGYADLDDIHLAMSDVRRGTLYNAKNDLGIESMSTGFGFDKRTWWYFGMEKEDVRKMIAENELDSS